MATNLWLAMKELAKGNIAETKGFEIPLIRWQSYSTGNMPTCVECNRMIYWANPEIVMERLYQGCKIFGKFKMLKKIKDEEKEVYLKRKYQKEFGWSDAEWKACKRNVLIIEKDKEVIEAKSKEGGLGKWM